MAVNRSNPANGVILSMEALLCMRLLRLFIVSRSLTMVRVTLSLEAPARGWTHVAADVEAAPRYVPGGGIRQLCPGVHGETAVETVRRIDLNVDVVYMAREWQCHPMIGSRVGSATIVADGTVGPSLRRVCRRGDVLCD